MAKQQLILRLCVAAFLTSTAATSAHAGFQWVGPANYGDNNAATIQNTMPSVPAEPVQAMPSMPRSTLPMPAPSPQPVLAPQIQMHHAPAATISPAAPNMRAPQVVLQHDSTHITPVPGGVALPQQMRQSSGPAIIPRTNVSVHANTGQVSLPPQAIAAPQIHAQVPRRPVAQPMPAPTPASVVTASVAPAAVVSAPAVPATPTPVVHAPAVNAQIVNNKPMNEPIIGQGPIHGNGDVIAMVSHQRTPLVAKSIPVDAHLGYPRRKRPGKSMVPSNLEPVNAIAMAPQPVLAPSAPTAAPVTPMVPQMSIGSFDNAVGFGKDLPLMTAIKQIVPNDYGLSLSPGINTDAQISWEGGQPWNQVLNTALAPQGLHAMIQGQTVSISPVVNTPIMTPVPVNITTHQKTIMMEPIIDDAISGNIGGYDASMQAHTFPKPIIEAQYSGGVAGEQPVIMGGPMMEPMVQGHGTNTPQLYDTSVQFWAAPKDSTLREVLTSWTRKAGVELFWSSEYDYPISSAVNIEGDFESAVQNLLQGLEESDPRPLGRLHPNLPNGPAVLVIETRRLAN